MYVYMNLESVLAGSLKKLNNLSSKLVAQTTKRYCFLISLEYGVLLKSKI